MAYNRVYQIKTRSKSMLLYSTKVVVTCRETTYRDDFAILAEHFVGFCPEKDTNSNPTIEKFF